MGYGFDNNAETLYLCCRKSIGYKNGNSIVPHSLYVGRYAY